MDAFILSFPPPEETPLVISPASQQRTIAVLGFGDLELAESDDPVGDVFASELRSSLTRIAGLRVLGPETSKLLAMAGEAKFDSAKELMVTALLLGEVLLEGGRIQVNARLVGVPAGNEMWSTSVDAAIGDAIELQQGLLEQLIGVFAPGLDPSPVQGPRARAGDCADVYDLYLTGKQLSQRLSSDRDWRERGVELLREAVAIDDQCALAWEAIAVEAIDWSFAGFVRAGAAARRALEINESLPEAWTVLAEIAEQEKHWSDAEKYFLRALYADPTNARALTYYSETLVARGRVKDALSYALEAQRYEPGSGELSFHALVAAKYAGEAGLMLEHFANDQETGGKRHAFYSALLADAYLQKGETDHALEVYAEMGYKVADWFPDCVRARDDAGLTAGLIEAMQETVEQHKSGQLDEMQSFWWIGQVVRCSIWLGELDLAFSLMLDENSTVFFGDPIPTEAVFMSMFSPDSAILRQDPRFRELVVETGLLDYWRQWGWSDYCEADGDSFRCD
jgi:TolB-like protein